MDRRHDPRTIVTPYAFAVHPDLLGRPLATPWQRLGAILVDLVVIGFISQIGLAPLAIASTALLFWLAFRKPGRDVFGKIFRISVGCLGFLVLGMTVLVVLWLRFGGDVRRAIQEAEVDSRIETGELPGTPTTDEGEAGGVGILDVFQGFRGAAALQSAGTQEEAQGLMNSLAVGAFDAGVPRRQIRDLLQGLVPDGATWAMNAGGMIEEAIGTLGVPEAEAEAGPPPEAQAEPNVAGSSVGLGPTALDSIDRLNQLIERTEADRADAEAALERTRRDFEAERSRGTFSWLFGFIDELGIGFGWAAIYLTVTHAWWRGTSVGKRIFRIRVVMIDNRPLNWWLSFERAGGYAAGLATGLLGFAQIFWDPNRQAIHDKVSETFVIQEGKDPVPGPWIAEGNSQWARGRHGIQEAPGGSSGD
jgi:hypothetical protein